MKAIIVAVIAGLILYGAPVLAQELGGVEGLRLDEQDPGSYLPGGNPGGREVERRNMDDLNYIWPDVHDLRPAEVEQSEPEAK